MMDGELIWGGLRWVGKPKEEVVNDGWGPRCLCGHYENEHFRRNAHCHGAYATLVPGEDARESIEVHCPCDRFHAVEPGWHEPR